MVWEQGVNVIAMVTAEEVREGLPYQPCPGEGWPGGGPVPGAQPAPCLTSLSAHPFPVCVAPFLTRLCELPALEIADSGLSLLSLSLGSYLSVTYFTPVKTKHSIKTTKRVHPEGGVYPTQPFRPCWVNNRGPQPPALPALHAMVLIS